LPVLKLQHEHAGDQPDYQHPAGAVMLSNPGTLIGKNHDNC
jgi:hypothetical protein